MQYLLKEEQLNQIAIRWCILLSFKRF